jgi:subfamily B ATP-binding cassette protein HlyB/CyaB
MLATHLSIGDFLATISPFDRLPDSAREQLVKEAKLCNYAMGDAIAQRSEMSDRLFVLYCGTARELAVDPRSQRPLTLSILQPGAVIGALNWLRQIACETAIAREDVTCIEIPLAKFTQLLETQPPVREFWQNRVSPLEACELLGPEIARLALADIDLKTLSQQTAKAAQVYFLTAGRFETQHLDPHFLWFVSEGETKRLSLQETLKIKTSLRLVGLPLIDDSLQSLQQLPPQTPPKQTQTYPDIRAQGTIKAPLACFEMVAKYFGMPLRKSLLQRILERQNSFSLVLGGSIAEIMGLSAQLVQVNARSLSRVPTPALIRWRDSVAVLWETSPKALVIGTPEAGIWRYRPEQFAQFWGEQGQILLLERNATTPQQRFGLRWFLPSLARYRRVLLEVLLASFFVQLFGLANPLIIQRIIDLVISQNSLDALHVFGFFLLVVGICEAILGSLRTHLFADTTNRIDLSLGSQIIDHLLRLPLAYFDKRPVGELASRVGELEQIRSFLTGTALTVVMDTLFSVIYIAVMAIYSWKLTLVTLAVVPILAGLTLLVSPLVRQQLRVKAERNAQTQSYLVEVLSGIQTVKAQNIELRSRMSWQNRYARYVSAGFKTLVTSTLAGSASSLLNKISQLLVLWVGAYLVLQGELSLGELIAFRIIAGYVTSPIMRLSQLWQNFQETALSLERLSDIMDAPAEQDESQQGKIPMPAIAGSITYENISFRFPSSSSYQLKNINLHIQNGQFIGIVGQSGSGKSTLTKLLSRLYEPKQGRILIDNYDIHKVELYSLRSQLRIVPQDTLLFDGTVEENIALTHPDATPEAIIHAAQIAEAHDFIMELPQGYNTRVGERGSALSGGQRQRIAIARAVLQTPQLLILDEATSALDYVTEQKVCANLQQEFKGRTVLFITHRLNSIQSADSILVMAQGAIAERGTHDELIAQQGLYYCLFQQQN